LAILTTAQRGSAIMPTFNPELIQMMRAALEEVTTKIPAEQATPEVKAYLAERILKAAAEGETTYDGLIAAATNEIQTILSTLI
jgi:hypothetical protein